MNQEFLESVKFLKMALELALRECDRILAAPVKKAAPVKVEITPEDNPILHMVLTEMKDNYSKSTGDKKLDELLENAKEQ